MRWSDPVTSREEREVLEAAIADAMPALRAVGLFSVLEARDEGLRTFLADRRSRPRRTGLPEYLPGPADLRRSGRKPAQPGSGTRPRSAAARVTGLNGLPWMSRPSVRTPGLSKTGCLKACLELP